MIQALRRLVTIGFLTLLIFSASRALIRALPGDPIETLIAESGTSIPPAELSEQLGLHRPFFQGLIVDLWKISHGDWGVSIISKKPIGPMLKDRFLKTAVLSFSALAIALILSLFLGLLAAQRPGGVIDSICSLNAALMAAFPTPWIAPVWILIFSVWIPIFPIGGSVALPALTLGFALSGLWGRLIRERVAETLRHGSAPGARARGIPEYWITLKYGLMPAAGGLLAFLGTQAGHLLAGAFVTEVIFSWPGMGSFLVDAVLKRDYPSVEAGAFLAATCALLGTSMGDFLQVAVDPRQRKSI